MKSPETILNNTRKYRRTAKGVLTNSYHKQVERCRKLGKDLPTYSLKELHIEFIDNLKFIRLFNEWVKSGYTKQLKPSIDRINCFKPYLPDNIHIMTWAENRYKQRMEFKRIRARKVYQLLNNKVIVIYNSVSHAVKITGLNQSGISMCLNNKRNYCGGYKWSYENPELLTTP